ncbi:hypothetical protein BT96DRAFT_447712 [Gymnopus androsaceus JB14]|uniref:Uncharacterized protein n=1 Tax=Gymnopus androsaceus JB14 TaxID=1447944 RepID=A0A6A4I260_9AGAR|nr:hypothetical protein BT96DRAFT_447712 [Gymnopus androsaceus JB14]
MPLYTPRKMSCFSSKLSLMTHVETQSAVDISSSYQVKVYTVRYAGLPILHSHALAWANRIRTKPGKSLLTDSGIHTGRIIGSVGDEIEAAGGFGLFGLGRPEKLENRI